MRDLVLTLLASGGVMALVACGSSGNGAPDGGQYDGSIGSSSGASGSSSGGSGGSSGSSSSAGSDDSGSAMGEAGQPPMQMQIGTPPTSIAGGVYCPGNFGAMAACAAPQVCCWGDQSQSPPPLNGCTGASSCTGSVIACSETSQCASGQVCCFVFTADAGATVPGTLGPFTAQCATTCATGDMVHYRLCGTSSDCASGEICNNMAPYSPYCAALGNPDGGIGDAGQSSDAGSAADVGPTSDASDAGSAADVGRTSDASDAGPG